MLSRCDNPSQPVDMVPLKGPAAAVASARAYRFLRRLSVERRHLPPKPSRDLSPDPSCVKRGLRPKVVDFAALQQSRAYDLAMRVPLAGWATLVAVVSAVRLARDVGDADPALPNAVYAINTATRLSTIAFLILLAASTILRRRPTGKARGIEPRLSALMGTSLVYAIALFPRRELSPAAETVSTLLVLVGSLAALFVQMRLGRSFSVMAEARQLVTCGLYRFVRHPLYLSEAIATIGLVMQFLSPWTALLFATQIAFQLRRMRNEEVVLGGIFPEYAAYEIKDRTADTWDLLSVFAGEPVKISSISMMGG
jgi:protein-S-isoprenylcysteine O-methyltransferase Ste14